MKNEFLAVDAENVLLPRVRAGLRHRTWHSFQGYERIG